MVSPTPAHGTAERPLRPPASTLLPTPTLLSGVPALEPILPWRLSRYPLFPTCWELNRVCVPRPNTHSEIPTPEPVDVT